MWPVGTLKLNITDFQTAFVECAAGKGLVESHCAPNTLQYYYKVSKQWTICFFFINYTFLFNDKIMVNQEKNICLKIQLLSISLLSYLNSCFLVDLIVNLTFTGPLVSDFVGLPQSPLIQSLSVFPFMFPFVLCFWAVGKIDVVSQVCGMKQNRQPKNTPS